MIEFLRKTPKEEEISDKSDEGSAILEFVALGVMLFVPTVYFLLTIFAIQAASLASASASQEAIMVIRNQGEKREVSTQSALAAAQLVAEDYKIKPDNLSIDATCLDSNCDRVKVTTSVKVDLPLAPWLAPQGIGSMTSEANWWGGKYR